MKKSYALLLALLCSTALQAQTRLVSKHYAVYDGTQYNTSDSVTIAYKPGNTNHGGHADYAFGDLKFDESKRVNKDATIGLYTSEQKNYDYDSKWNTVKYTLQKPYPQRNDPMKNSYQEQYVYDNNNNETLRIGLRWNHTTNAWDTSSRETRAYDANQNIVLLDAELYYQPNGFRGSLRRTYAYDANNNRTVYVAESWVTANSAYDTFSRQLFTYDANNNNDTLTFQNFNRTTRMWENSSKAYYVFTNGYASEYVHTFWVNGQWENRYQTFTNINSQTGTSVNIYNNWNTNTNQWDKDTKDSTYTVSTNPKVTETISYTWNSNTNTYDKTTKQINHFNADDYATLNVKKSWDAANSQWATQNQDDSTVWRYEGTPSTSIATMGSHAPALVLYPNPASGSHISLEVSHAHSYTLAIYNLQGILVAQQYVANGSTVKSIPVAHLANGQYILSVKSEMGNVSKQFSIVR